MHEDSVVVPSGAGHSYYPHRLSPSRATRSATRNAKFEGHQTTWNNMRLLQRTWWVPAKRLGNLAYVLQIMGLLSSRESNPCLSATYPTTSGEKPHRSEILPVGAITISACRQSRLQC